MTLTNIANATQSPSSSAPLAADEWHERLVNYYSYFGFEEVVRVEGGRLSDVPHMLVWGGAGTRMDGDVVAMLRRWTPVIRKDASRTTTRQQPPSTRSAASASSTSPESASSS